MYIRFVGICLIFAWGLGGCANVQPLTGGKKDTKPPVLLAFKSYPKFKSTNFKGDRIILYFNEWIKEEKLSQNLIITPSLKTYRSKVTKDRIEIRWEQPLDTNTTYTFNFRKGIVDITESNICLNPKWVFSTGSTIDTLGFSGQVRNLLTGASIENALVALYIKDDTSKVDKDPPAYLSLTDAAGMFTFENIRPDTYDIFAFVDKNNNQFYNEPELIAFRSHPIALRDSAYAEGIRLWLAPEDHTPPEIRRGQNKANLFEVSFEEGLRTFYVDSGKIKNPAFTYRLNDKADGILFYNLQSSLNRDSIPVSIIAYDSAYNRTALETKIFFDPADFNKKEKFSLNLAQRTQIPIEQQLALDFKFNKPVLAWYPDKIKIQLDPTKALNQYGWAEQLALFATDKLPKTYPLWPDNAESQVWNMGRNLLQTDSAFAVKQKIEIIAEEGAFISVEGDTSKYNSLLLELKEEKNYGSLAISLKINAPHFIVQLTDDKFNVKRELFDQSKIVFKYLPPATYFIRVIMDENQNKIWDGSDFKKDKHPEKILVHPQSYKIRENWDLSETIDFETIK